MTRNLYSTSFRAAATVGYASVGVGISGIYRLNGVSSIYGGVFMEGIR